MCIAIYAIIAILFVDFCHNIITSLLFASLSVQYILMSTDWKEVSTWIASQFRMRSMALWVWFYGCCPCQILTCLGFTCKEMLFVWLHVSWTEFGTYRDSLCFIYDQIRVSDMCLILICYETTMMMMKCKHHESRITIGIEPNGQTQRWEHTSVQAHW